MRRNRGVNVRSKDAADVSGNRAEADELETNIALCELRDEDVCEECDGPEDFWQRSAGNHASVAIALRAYWSRQFGDDWRTFPVPSDLITLAEQAAKEWAEVAAELRARAAQ